jgi:hypothetical protein
MPCLRFAVDAGFKLVLVKTGTRPLVFFVGANRVRPLKSCVAQPPSAVNLNIIAQRSHTFALYPFNFELSYALLIKPYRNRFWQ